MKKQLHKTQSNHKNYTIDPAFKEKNTDSEKVYKNKASYTVIT